MFNKPLIFVTKSSCLLLFLLVLTSSTSGNPLSRNEESVSKKVVDFNVHITESGVEYNETIEVDTQKQTEVFKVPAHPGVDRSDVMHDFKQKLTLMRIPEKGMCYLMPLPKELSTPEKLIRDLERVNQGVISNVKRIDSTWMLNGELTERSFLSDDLQQFCSDLPIYLLKKAQDSLAVTGIQEAEIKNRLKRQAKVRPLCSGGMTKNEALKHCLKPDLKCKVETQTCYKWVRCSVGGRDNPNGPALMRMGITFSAIPNTNKCWEFHEWSNLVCCHYVCD